MCVCTQRYSVSPARRRASVRHCSTQNAACPHPSIMLLCAIPGYCLNLDLQYHHAFVRLSVILMLSATLPVCLCVHLCTTLHVRIAVSTLCVRLPTCLSIWCFHSRAVVLSLYMPSLAFCTHCAYASAVCLSVPLWVLFTDR